MLEILEVIFDFVVESIRDILSAIPGISKDDK